MTIDWPVVQGRLGVLADNKPGPITYNALISVVGNPNTGVARALADYAHSYGQDASPERLAEFVAEIANETGGFTTWEENLNYSVQGLVRTWPTHFTLAKAQACVGHPDKIAECAYGGRMGNDREGSGDGWKYRGRGALQLTGRANYADMGSALGLDLVGRPELASDPYDSTRIALEFFRRRGVNAAIDAGDFTEARRLTNGGSIGLENVAKLRGWLLAKLA